MILEYLDNFKEKEILYWDTIFRLSQIVEIQYIFLLIFTFSGFYSRDDVSIILWPADATGVTQWQVVLSAARARPNYLLRVDAVQVHLRRLGANGQLCTLITTFLVKLSLSLFRFHPTAYPLCSISARKYLIFPRSPAPCYRLHSARCTASRYPGPPLR